MSKFAQVLESLIKSGASDWDNSALASDNMTIASLPEGVATIGGVGAKGVLEDKKDPTLEWMEGITKKTDNA